MRSRPRWAPTPGPAPHVDQPAAERTHRAPPPPPLPPSQPGNELPLAGHPTTRSRRPPRTRSPTRHQPLPVAQEERPRTSPTRWPVRPAVGGAGAEVVGGRTPDSRASARHASALVPPGMHVATLHCIVPASPRLARLAVGAQREAATESSGGGAVAHRCTSKHQQLAQASFIRLDTEIAATSISPSLREAISRSGIGLPHTGSELGS
jgi:hypothetical protein